MLSRKPWAALAFLAPALLVYAVFALYPLVRGLQLSFTDSRGGPQANFVGLDQYVRMLGDDVVAKALTNTLVYAVVVVVVINVLAIVLARAIYARPRSRPVATLLILLPSLMAPVMSSFIFAYLYAPDGGINSLLRAVGLDSWTRIWLGDPSTALWAVASVNVWMYVGYNTIIFVAGYVSLPADILEAADIDGAGGWTRFARIEWPLLAPSFTVAITLSLIGALKVFEFPFVLTRGGPANATQTLSLQVYQNVFGSGSNFAYGIAISVLLLAIVILVTTFANGVLGRRERNI